MLKQLWEYIRTVILLTERVERHDTDIKELRQELKEVQAEIREIRRNLDALLAALHQLRSDQEHERQHTADQHEKLLFRLEAEFLRFERRLPPSSPPDDTPSSRPSAPMPGCHELSYRSAHGPVFGIVGRAWPV